MNNFKVGDEVWFFYTNYGRNCWGEEDTIIYPTQTEILSGKIVLINEDKDYVHIYVDKITTILDMGYTFFNEWVFKSKQEAIDAMLKQLEKLK